jgi:leucyl-tRNA synthetase
LQFRIKSDTHTISPVHVFTTRPDTLFGVTYLALSLSHPIVEKLAEDLPDLRAFLSKKSSFSPDSKEGFLLPSISALHPLSTSSDRLAVPLPIFVAPYVLEDYGEGAVMGVPGHDARDLAFWKKHQPESHIPLVVSSGAPFENLEPIALDLNEAFPDRGVLTPLCGQFAGLQSVEAGKKIVNELHKKRLGEMAEMWRLRDWLVSRQRYWGTPIPVIHCKSCGIVPVPQDQLPVELPRLDSSVRGMTGNPLDKLDAWVNTVCPSCHGPAKRETDTMDTFVDSSWYYMRFPDAHNDAEPFSLQSASSTLPVDTYIGGVEHAILHLLYARFIYKFLASEGLIKQANVQEPFSQLVTQGMVHGRTFSDLKTGQFLLPHEVEGAETPEPKIIATGETPAVTWEKMSKSKHNGVDPSTCIQKYGADATRAHILFAAPVSEILQWDEEKIVGVQRWFHRISRLVSQFPDKSFDLEPKAFDHLSRLTGVSADAFVLTQNTIKTVTRTFEQDIYGLNTAVSDLIKLTNGLTSMSLSTLDPWVAYDSLSALLRMLAPIAPAFAEQCWEELHTIVNNPLAYKSVLEAGWPEHILTADLEARYQERMKTTTCAVQVNGKLRFTAEVPVVKSHAQNDNDRKAIESLLITSILETEEGKYWLIQKNDWEKRKRVVVVGGGKLVNIVF